MRPTFGDVVVRDAAGNVLRVDPPYSFREHRAVVDPVAYRRDSKGVVGPFVEKQVLGGRAGAKVRVARRRYEGAVELPEGVKHGTRYAYGHYKCRCGDCEGAETAWRQVRNQRARDVAA